MIINTKNNRQVYLRRLYPADLDSLCHYLNQLSPDTKKRFGPHGFSRQAIIDFYNSSNTYSGYIAHVADTTEIVAYVIIKTGYLQHDYNRLAGYGIAPHNVTDCTFAPSVADAWQGLGIGNKLLQFIVADVKAAGIKRIILWGGVQATNHTAVKYYTRNGFTTLGQFTYNGENYDMMLEI